MKVKISSKEQAKELYDKPELIKSMLEKGFGKETFRKLDHTDYDSFDDLCRFKGTTEEEFEAKLKDLPISDQAKRFIRMELIAEVFNQGWEHDTMDTSQYKWAPIFTVSSGGLDFSSSGYYYVFAIAYVGSCLCYKSKIVSDYIGKHPVFGKMWKEFITGKNL
jgi:hypothetical protein